MKYFTKEELEEITEKLIENPTREMLKELNGKYNGEASPMIIEQPVSTPVQAMTEMPVEKTTLVEPLPTATIGEPVATPMPSVEQPVAVPLETPVNIGTQIPSFEVPQQVVPNGNATKPINFTGNLWEPQEQNNLMSTTDSFNASEYPNNTEVPVQPGQFFGNTEQPANNPIPVSEAMPHIPQPQGPSMFGQFEQNYNG